MGLQIRSEMKELSSVERQLSIVVPGSEVAKELDRAYRELGTQVRLKGFRPGKVPRYVLEQYYKQETEQRVLERLVGSSFREAVKTHSIEPVANPQIQSAAELIPGMDFSFSAKVEVKPALALKDYKGLALKKTTYTVGDDDLGKELERLRSAQAKVAPVEGRDVVQQGDLVEVNWSGTVDGEHMRGLSGISFTIEIGGGSFKYKEAEQALVGKKIGDNFTVDVVLPADFPVESARGKTAVFKINVLGIKARTLPALDDEFAKDVGDEFETLDQLKKKLREELERMAKQKGDNELKDAAIEALIKDNPFDVPASLIDRQAEQIAVERLQRLPQEQAEAVWQAQGLRMKEDAKPLAQRQVRVSLILEELVKKEGVQITDADLDAHFDKLAGELGTDKKTVQKVYNKGRRLEELKFQLSTQRMLDRVIEAAKLEETTKAVTAA